MIRGRLSRHGSELLAWGQSSLWGAGTLRVTTEQGRSWDPPPQHGVMISPALSTVRPVCHDTLPPPPPPYRTAMSPHGSNHASNRASNRGSNRASNRASRHVANRASRHVANPPPLSQPSARSEAGRAASRAVPLRALIRQTRVALPVGPGADTCRSAGPVPCPCGAGPVPCRRTRMIL